MTTPDIEAIRARWLGNIRKAVDVSFNEHTEHLALFCASVMQGVLDDLDTATVELAALKARKCANCMRWEEPGADGCGICTADDWDICPVGYGFEKMPKGEYGCNLWQPKEHLA